MGRPAGSTNQAPRPDKDCEHTIELDTELSVRFLCKEYGITATGYHELSNLNAPHHVRPMSYSRFAQAMARLPIAEEHVDMLAHSLVVVRQELRRRGARPLGKVLSADFANLMKLWADNPDILPKKELTALRSIVRRALARKVK